MQIEAEALRPLLAAALRAAAIEGQFDAVHIDALPVEAQLIWIEEQGRFYDQYGYLP